MMFVGALGRFKWPDGTVTRTFAIIITNAYAMMAEHDRLPVVLEPLD
jgi:putative SOS response-associated peptidase YedK